MQSEVADSKNCRTEKMKNTQPEVSKPKRGWPSKKVMAGRSWKVFSLDFLFIERMLRLFPKLQARPSDVGRQAQKEFVTMKENKVNMAKA